MHSKFCCCCLTKGANDYKVYRANLRKISITISPEVTVLLNTFHIFGAIFSALSVNVSTTKAIGKITIFSFLSKRQTRE